LAFLFGSTGLALTWLGYENKKLHAEQVQPPSQPNVPPINPSIPVKVPKTVIEPEPPKLYSAAWDSNWDRREPTSKETTPAATRHLILIRHGQYHTKAATPEEKRLTKLGCEQAMATGYRLSNFPYPITKVYHSDMPRAIETANIVCKFLPGVPVSVSSLLAEGAPIHPIPGPTITPEREQYVFEDGPRIEAAFRKIFHRADVTQKEDSYEVIIGHANVIRYFVCRGLQVAPEAWLRMSINHCGMTFVDIKPNGKVILRAFGDSGHLDFSQITTS